MLHILLNDDLIKNLKELQNLFVSKFSEVIAYPNEATSFMAKLARASIIGGSTRIENALLTDEEISWMDTILESDGKTTAFQINKDLIKDKLSKDRERSIEEVAGCRQMLHYIFDQYQEMVPLTETHIRGFHYELLSPYEKGKHYAGVYKTQTNSVIEYNQATQESRTVFKTADAGPVTNAAMHDLICWYNKITKGSYSPFVVATELVYRFLAIHPFQDGNGRLGRGLFLLSLLQSNDIAIKSVLPFIAIDRHIERHKSDYYVVLNRCSNGQYSEDPSTYRMDYFLKFMIKILRESLGDIDYYYKKYISIQELSESAIQVYNCFKNHPEQKLTRKTIVEITNLPERTAGHSLATLVDKNLIQKYGKNAGARYQITF